MSFTKQELREHIRAVHSFAYAPRTDYERGKEEALFALWERLQL